MIISWNDGERDSYFTGDACDIGYVWSGNKADARDFDDPEDLGEAIETLLDNNFTPIKVEK